MNHTGLAGRRRPTAVGLALLVSALTTPCWAQTAWIAQNTPQTVSWINVGTDTVIPGSTSGGDISTFAATVATATRVYVANGSSVSIFDAATGSLVVQLPLGIFGGFRMMLSADGSRLYVLGQLGIYSIVDTTTNTQIAVRSLSREPFAFAISPDGSILYFTERLGTSVYARNAATTALIREYTGFTSTTQIVLSPDGATAYVADGSALAVLNLATGGITSVSGIAGTLAQAISADGSAVYGGSTRVARYLTGTGAVNSVAMSGGVTGIALTPDQSKLYVTRRTVNLVSVLDATTLATIVDIPFGSPSSIGSFISPTTVVPPAPVSVPTLSEWAMILFGVLLAAGAAIQLRRRAV